MATTVRIVDIVPPAPALAAVRTHSEGPRRFLNVAIAAVGLVLSLPLLVTLAALIKLTSRGPVFYKQTRIGLDRRSLSYAGGNSRRQLDLGGKPFTIYKLRTMTASRDTREVWAAPDDHRVTPVGRVLRRLRLDELPQLLNVLKGDMNIVGPRPEQPAIFVELRELVEGYQRRQRVRPGITGLAQVTQGYDTCVEDVRRKVRYDLAYIRRQSIVEDLKIMLRTVPVMLGMQKIW